MEHHLHISGRRGVQHARRGGAVIILSLAMLMSLLFLGLFFFAFVDDESSSADIYARQSRAKIDVSNRHVMNHGLSQVLVGTNDSDPDQSYYARYSVLRGGRYSILAHILGPIGEHDWNLAGGASPSIPHPDDDLDGDGYFDPWTPTDFDPFNGGGMKVFEVAGVLYLELNGDGADTNGDGTPDRLLTDLRLNGSELAGGNPTRFDAFGNPVGLDAGYTYPDLNALYLYHEVVDPSDRVNGTVVVKPSFDVPGLLYASSGYSSMVPNDISGERVLRPHTSHGFGAGIPRFLTANTAAASGTPRTIPRFDVDYLMDNPANMGVWNMNGRTTHPVPRSDYDFHVDADNDGINDSFLMDMDYPLISFPDGRQAVPMFFWRIEDADALVNLNTAGDMPLYRMAERSSTPPARANIIAALESDARYLTGGNHGRSPSEVNPGLPLRADPSNSSGLYLDVANAPQALDQYEKFYAEQGGIPGPGFDRHRIANTELAWLLSGRHTYDSAGAPLPSEYDLIGRYGEPGFIVAGSPVLAAAGTTGMDNQGRPFDDDGDSNAGQRPGGGAAYREFFPRRNGTPQVVPAVPMPPAVHPIDATGFGTWLTGATGTDPGLRRLFRAAADTNNPSRWLYYNSTAGTPFGNVPLWQYPVASAAGVTPWLSGGGSMGYLQAHNPANPVNALWDEPDELVLDDSNSRFTNLDDDPFPASEMSGLHLSDPDWSRLNTTSRVRQLAPINFEVNYQAGDIRRHFTTVSWDRPELGFAYDPARSGEWYTVQDDVTNPSISVTHLYFPPNLGRATTLPFTPSPSDPDNPDYRAAPVATPAKYISARDAFRPETRKLLTFDFNARTGNHTPNVRLELNGILSDDSLGGGAGQTCFDRNGNPRFRPLVPHPVIVAGTDGPFTPSAMVHDNGAAVPHAFTTIGSNKRAQEWWARYDRQRLARDIYTLLWVVGAPPGVDVSTGTPYTPEQAREMAQFAVNVVDAMDHDNVITKFEYDANLVNGWDDPVEVVYGTEAQVLTLSEGLWIRSREVSMFDHPATLWDDSVDDVAGEGTGDRHFLYTELRNSLPFDVRLGNGTYQIVRADDGVEGQTLTFEGDLATGLVIGPGENFLIGTHNDPTYQTVGGMNPGQVQSADFRLDYTADAAKGMGLEYHAMVPYLSETDPPGSGTATITDARQEYPDPLCDLDLCHRRDRITTQRFEEATDSVGYFLAGMPATGEVELVLKRRINTQADGVIDDSANDWVEIDRMTIYRNDYQLTDSSSATEVQQQFYNNVRSRERMEPLFAHANGEGGEDNMSTNAFFKHTLGGPDPDTGGTDPATQTPDDTRKHQKNSRLTAAPFQTWQPHFDRGFTSVYDLLSVPTIGPESLIYHDRDSTPVEGGLFHAGSRRMLGIHTAAVRFLNPSAALQPPYDSIPEIAGEHYENRWFRLLEFLSVPSHTHDEIADQMTYRRRVPGRINLNTLRHEHNLAAIINDPIQLEVYDVNQRPTNDRFSVSPQRNWYDELRRTRDGFDATTGVPYPPGTPYAVPFRPLTYDSVNNVAGDPLANTILRRHADTTTMPGFDQIGLFEARDPGDVGTETIDWHTRHRLLSKIANLTTNRSHVYVIWAGYQMHHAHDADPNGPSPRVQIGGRMTDIPVYRELIVVDMSRMEEAFDAPSGAFNFEGFILHREALP